MKITLTDTEAYFTICALETAIAAQENAATLFRCATCYDETQRAALARSALDRAQVLRDVKNKLDS